MPHPIDALISDCDGVLVDSEVIAEHVMYKVLGVYAPLGELQCLPKGISSPTNHDILDRAEKHSDLCILDSSNRKIRQRSEEMVAQAQLIPGAYEALLALDLSVVVTSNSRRHSPEHSLIHARLNELIGERLASVDMVALLEPAPDVYLHIVSLLDVAPGCCLVMEGGNTGIRVALVAGTRVIGFIDIGYIPVGHAEVLREPDATAIAEHMHELPGTVTRLRRES